MQLDTLWPPPIRSHLSFAYLTGANVVSNECHGLALSLNNSAYTSFAFLTASERIHHGCFPVYVFLAPRFRMIIINKLLFISTLYMLPSRPGRLLSTRTFHPPFPMQIPLRLLNIYISTSATITMPSLFVYIYSVSRSKSIHKCSTCYVFIGLFASL